MRDFIRHGLLSIPEMLFWYFVCIALFPLALVAVTIDWAKNRYSGVQPEN